ncbi:hypothetical protein FJ05194_2644 [Mycobacterium tuberculosis FJ05194]|nr:hypothetical protein FJ05194_2644 [Mycobacterium tuberculosis FJ05194]KAF3410922.1 dipZ domain protein [Mycobacterium tuberculosis variant bovis]
MSRDELLRRLRHTQADAGLHPRPRNAHWRHHRRSRSRPVRAAAVATSQGVPVVTHDGDFDAVDGVADVAIIRI